MDSPPWSACLERLHRCLKAQLSSHLYLRRVSIFVLCPRLALLSMDPFSISVGIASLFSNILKQLEACHCSLKTRDHAFHELYRQCQKMAQVLQSIQSGCAMTKDLELVDRRILGDFANCSLASYSLWITARKLPRASKIPMDCSRPQGFLTRKRESQTLSVKNM